MAENVSLLDHFDDSTIDYDPTSLNSIYRLSVEFSSTSVNTLLPRQGGYGGSLNFLRQLVDSYTALQYATIISAECYTQRIMVQLVQHPAFGPLAVS